MGPSASAGKKVRPPMIRITPTSSPTNSAHGREGAGRGGHGLLGHQRAGDRHRRNDDEVAPEQHREAAGHVVPERVAGEAGERRAVVAGLRRVGIEHLAEAVRAGIVAGGDRDGTTTATAVKPSIISGRTRMASIAILTSLASIFLPRYSGVRPTIRPATNMATMTIEQHAVEARADAAVDDLAELDHDHAASCRRAA